MHQFLEVIVLLCSLGGRGNAKEYEASEMPGRLAGPRFYYDHVLVKFDPSCLNLAQQNVTLPEYFKEALSNAKKGKLTSNGDAFNALHQDNNTLPDPDHFYTLLISHLPKAKVFYDPAKYSQDRIDLLVRQQQEGFTHRRLMDMSVEDRESELLAALHILAASRLVGNDFAATLLDFEHSGKYDELIQLLQSKTRIDLKNDTIATLQSLAQKRSTQSHTSLQNVDQDSITPTRAATPSGLVASAETLPHSRIHIIHNPVLLQELLPLAKLLPCLEFDPEPNRSKDALGVIDPLTLRPLIRSRALQSASTGLINTSHIFDDESTIADELSNSTIRKYEVLSEMEEDMDDDDSFKKKLTSVFKSISTKFKSSPVAASKKYFMIAPDDPHFDEQWYLKGNTQSEKYGSQVIDGWSRMLKEGQESATTAKDGLEEKVSLDFADLPKVDSGMVVAVLDSGCSKNPDLVNQFWRNEDTPGCSGRSFVGSNKQVADAHGIKRDCIGYDFGNDSPDPTQEVSAKIHGSSTSGLIAAESNNGLGIAGICPNCQIMCLKIYDSDKGTITMTSVVRALDYIARKKIKISNHSYGGFGSSNVEYAAHKALDKIGHLSVCSSGNNGCNIDDPNDAKACVNKDGDFMGPFTPATYDIPTILSVGGTTEDGHLAWFSNYGARSIHVFAPGDSILTLYGANDLAKVKGTSFSSPIVAGIAATLWSYHPELTALQVKNLLMKTGTPVKELRGKAREGRIVSLSRALNNDRSLTTAPSSSGVFAPSVRRFILSITITASLLLLTFTGD